MLVLDPVGVVGGQIVGTCVVNHWWGRMSLSIFVFSEILGELSAFGSV